MPLCNLYSKYNQTEPSLDGEAVKMAYFGIFFCFLILTRPNKVELLGYLRSDQTKEKKNKNISANFQYSEGL